ncbi:hypothetical protein H5410_015589 [Solanum commersonii]|uniref:Uncharacterized protein n=1 Tax=Solanum commersonii TaxID=4109 RepID=A0A9J5ZTY0_SOLCO|nr:hypothetical protein H5410_015589 [Solanum commersonii]
MGHVKGDCYRLIGYPPDFKFKKKFGNPNAPNVQGGDQRSRVNFVRSDDGRVYNDAGPNRATYTDPNKDLQNNGKSAMMTNNHKGDGFSDGPGPSNYTQTQYNQMAQYIDNPNHYEQFQRITNREKVGEPSANMNSMGGNAFASILPTTDSAGNASTPFMPRSEKNWIIDTGVSNHMISYKDITNSKEAINVIVNAKKVQLPNGGIVNVSQIGDMANVPQVTPAPLIDSQPDDHMVDPQIDEPAVDILAVAVPRQSNRPRKLPTWMDDFVTNSVVVSTPYLLSQSLTPAEMLYEEIKPPIQVVKIGLTKDMIIPEDIGLQSEIQKIEIPNFYVNKRIIGISTIIQELANNCLNENVIWSYYSRDQLMIYSNSRELRKADMDEVQRWILSLLKPKE